MFKVGIVGCGGIGMAHARSWSAIPGVKIAGVADLDAEKAKAAADFCKCPFFTDMMNLPGDLDAVSVVTPPGVHYPVVKAMLKRGFHVFCEKPLTMDVRQGEELDRLAAETGKVLAVGFKMRYEPIFTEAKKYLPEVGTPRSIVTTKLQKFNTRPGGEWVTRVGAMYELSIHDFDLLSFLTGLFPERVISARLAHRRGWDREDAFSAMVEYGDGVTAMLQGMYCDEATFCFRDLTITLLGENGYMRIERPDRIVLHTREFRVVEVPAAAKSAFVLELEHFRNAAEGKCENDLKAADAVRMTKLIEEIRSFDRR